MTADSSIEDLLQSISSHARHLDMDLIQALSEKEQEICQRAFLRLIPNPALRDAQMLLYLRLLLGTEPDQGLLERLSIGLRRPRLTPEELMSLEERQYDRCALCGTYLSKNIKPQVDHILPVALGGTNEPANLQLLCQICNLGKSSLVGWQPGAPFLQVGITPRVRYCVLARASAKCQVLGCLKSSHTSVLEVVPRIPESAGGRLILDNLMVMCRTHREHRDRTTRRKALAALALKRHKTVRHRW